MSIPIRHRLKKKAHGMVERCFLYGDWILNIDQIEEIYHDQYYN